MSVRVQVCRLGTIDEDEPAIFWVDEDEFNQRVIWEPTGLAICGEWFDVTKIAHVHVDDFLVEPPRNETWN